MKPFTYNVPQSSGRRFAIGDIHGCFHTFCKLLDELAVNKSDQIFLLGDMIGRGLHSKEVVDFIIDHNINGYNFFPLRGNHEQFTLNQIINKNNSLATHLLPKKNTPFGDESHYKHSYISFLNELPFFFFLDKAVLVHAGFSNPSDPFSDATAMLLTRNGIHSHMFFGNRRVIHGHTPVSIDNIQNKLKHNALIIGIDNACVYNSHNDGKGNLACLNIDTLEPHFVRNCEK